MVGCSAECSQEINSRPGDTILCGKGGGSALWLLHGSAGSWGPSDPSVDTIDCGNETPRSGLVTATQEAVWNTPGLGDPSGSCLRVDSHGVIRLLVSVFIVGFNEQR